MCPGGAEAPSARNGITTRMWAARAIARVDEMTDASLCALFTHTRDVPGISCRVNYEVRKGRG
jgi:hypothetical protein